MSKHERKDPFRTLDDPEPTPTPAPQREPEPEPTPEPAPEPVKLGYWRAPAFARPSRLRRWLVWLLLGWKWYE